MKQQIAKVLCIAYLFCCLGEYIFPYATAYGISDWVTADSVPAGAEVVDRKWVYDQRIYQDSREPNLSGYTLQSEEWQYEGSGSINYASVPSGFDTGHQLYSQLANSAYTGYQNETNRRDISNTWTGYVYWHWMYEIAGTNEYDARNWGLQRAYNNQQEWNNFGNFSLFRAFLSSADYPLAPYSTYYCCNKGLTSYNCTDAYGSWDNDGQMRFMRFDYYTSSYTDYYHLFHYVRYEYNLESASPVYESDTIYNVRAYAKYKNTFTVSYDANGGQGAPEAQTKTYGNALSLSALIPTKTDYEFRGWATSADTAYAEYQPGQGFEREADTTLYAVWAYPSGQCGDAVNWTLTGTHLYLEGSGAMFGYEDASAVPWRGYVDRITEATIGEGITSIGSYTFAECRNLASLSLPTTLLQVGSYAFDHCSNLENIEIPNGVTTLASHCFQSCERLSTITIPDSVSRIEEAAFFGCSALSALSLPVGTEHIGAHAFAACPNLTEINIPSGVRTLSAHLFDSDEKLTALAVPNTVETIEEYCFSGCASLAEVSISHGLISIATGAFAGCSSLSYITIPDSVTNIGISIFAYVRESVTVRCFVDSAIYSYAQENGISTELLSRGKLELPSFQQAPTTGGVMVSISSSSGTIHYTTDGTEPTGESPIYSAPFTVRSANTTIKAVATTVGWESSDTAVLDIALEKVASPFASHPSGSRVSAGTRVELYCQTEGAEIRFTTDGNIPAASNVYREPVEITEDTTLYVVAVRDGMLDSVLSVFSYQIAGQEEPVVSTLEAVNITDSSAMISAHLDQPDDVVYVQFVYYEKNRSQAKYTVQADANYCAVLSGLSPDTEYWYQACAVNNTGWHSGSILSFKTDIAEDAKPVSIELNPTYLLIHPGDTKTLLPTILPASASNRDVFWSSANPLVATVDTNGVVSATGLGSTTIEAVTVYGRLTASCTVEVTTTEISGVFDFSEWNMMTNSSRDDPHGFDHDVNAGGNAQMASAYLTRWDGPVTELSDPYPASAEDGAYHEIDAPYHVQNILYLPYRNDSLDNDEIKNAVMRYGAVYASLKINYDYFSDNQTNYYLPPNVRRYNGGHSIAIIGWDDNYSRTNFAVTPEGNGAFLCKNSWGADAGENGYFYVSYYDKTLARPDSNDYNAVFCGLESMDNYNKIYQYDYLGPVLPRPLGSPSAYVCNVFPEHGSALEENELLKAVSCYNYEPGTAYEVYVISDYASKSSLVDLGTPLQTGVFEYAGYYTIPLERALALSAGTRFAVVVRYTPPSGDAVIYAELPATISAQGRQIDHSSKARANADESYISVNARNWMDFTSVAANANVCVKAFTQTGTGGQAALHGIDNPGRHYENDTVYTFEELENLGFSVNPAFHDAFLLDGEEANTEEDFGFLPPSILPDLHTNHNYAEGCAFPESYDLRTENSVTSVKNQNPIGGCWSFAACASLESWAKKAQALSESLSEDGLNQASGQASSIALSTDGVILALGNTAQIRAELQPYDSTQSVLWLSSDSRVASVSTHGLVTALRTGNTYITASTLDGTVTAQCSVTVTAPQPLRMIAIDTPETQLSPGETLLMRYSLYPSNCANPTLEWHSSNPAVASVNQYGLLTAKSTGISEITVSSQDGKVSAPVQISVEGQDTLCTLEMEENLLSVEDHVISGSLACRVENPGEDMDGCLLIAAFYEGDRFLSFVRQTVAPRSGSNVFRFNEVRTGRTEGEEITVKVFLLSETLIPLSPPLSGHVERVDV